MRAFAVLAAFAGAALAQSTTGTATLLTGPPMGVYKTAYTASALTATTLTQTTTSSAVAKRSVAAEVDFDTVSPTATNVLMAKRSDYCVVQPTGISYTTSPDTPENFLNDTYYSNASLNAVTPSGWTLVEQDVVAANSADDYIGFTTLSSYDVQSCADQCAAISNCESFNIYFERDPSLYPDATYCPDPASLTRIKCVWWGGFVSLNNANNYGEEIADFYVVIAGGNGYVNSTDYTATSTAAASATTSTVMSTATDSAGSVYDVYYSSDSSTGSFSNAVANSSYTDCMTICDETSTCVAFTYVGGTYGSGAGTCWLKTSLGTVTTSDNTYVCAVRVTSGTDVVGYTASTTSTSSTSSSSSTSTSTTATTTVSLYHPVYGTTSTTSTTSSTSTTSPSTTSTSSSSASSSSASSTSTYPTSSPAPWATTSSSSSSASSSTSSSAASSSSTKASSSSASSSSSSAAASSSAVAVANKVAAATTSSSAVATTSSAAVATTMSTSTLASSSSTTSSSTTSSTSALGTFYIQVGTSQSSSNKYAYVNWLNGGAVSFVSSKSAATKFYLDSNGILSDINSIWLLSGYKASVSQTGGAWQKLGFSSLRSGMDAAGCAYASPYLECYMSNGFVYAGTCNNDNYLYFGLPSKMPKTCSWTGMYPVSV